MSRHFQWGDSSHDQGQSNVAVWNNVAFDASSPQPGSRSSGGNATKGVQGLPRPPGSTVQSAWTPLRSAQHVNTEPEGLVNTPTQIPSKIQLNSNHQVADPVADSQIPIVPQSKGSVEQGLDPDPEIEVDPTNTTHFSLNPDRTEKDEQMGVAHDQTTTARIMKTSTLQCPSSMKEELKTKTI
ncbi:hypothetical protein R1sor_010447 [Riccia sorocarpa]|uniref:Uncharacterized protein n=1 Tax=Riccia sorocarpa TaxID=122646 RepID=A0ABD3I252_9MARC